MSRIHPGIVFAAGILLGVTLTNVWLLAPAMTPPAEQLTIPPPRITVSPARANFALDGFCPVSLIEQYRWVPGEVSIGASHDGATFLFADAACRSKFLAAPQKYAPQAGGCDVVALLDHSQRVRGHRRHGISHDGRIYLFASEENLEIFCQSPGLYAVREVTPASFND